ncbi:MAG: DUF3298 domain-containing protein [Prevotella sp.]|nr:DUF3298 domain-containing protein [Prevotella sp.]
MKKVCRLSLPIVIALLLMLGACGKKKGVVSVAGYEIDSVVVDTTASLVKAAGAPTCQLSLHLHFLKDAKAQGLNDTLLREGILLPDYFSLNKEKLTVKALVDSFVGRYVEEYIREYAPLYRADQEHASAYNVEYRVHSRFQESASGVLTHIADVYSYGGGIHGIRQTLALNIDTDKGAIIRLADLFAEGSEQELKDKIVEQMAKGQKAKSLAGLQEKGIFADGEVYASENFILGKDDITFIYGEDEIAPHDVGEIRVKLDKDDIKKLMK